MKKVGKILFASALSLCAASMVAQAGAVQASANDKADFACELKTGMVAGASVYGCDSVVMYTAEEAAAAGLPEGYTDNVLEVCRSQANRGVTVDFSASKIPMNLIESLSWRAYAYVTSDTSGYPDFRIADPTNLNGGWVYRYRENNNEDIIGKWTTFSVTNVDRLNKLGKDGYLNAFELSVRSNTTQASAMKFYIDFVTPNLKANDGVAPVITYNGGDVVTYYQNAEFDISATAYDAQEKRNVEVEYIWENGVTLAENGVPAEVGTYALTLKATDYYGNVSEKTLTVEVKEVDTTAPVINFALNEIRTQAGAQPLFKPTATDNSSSVTVTSTWSNGALDKLGKLQAGEHTWTITATDASGNKSEKTVRVIVTEGEPAYNFVTDEEALASQYTVTFDGENPIQVKGGFKIAQPADPVKEADEKAQYTFDGWYNGDKLWDFENDVITEDTNLVSHWLEDRRVYNVMFDSGNRVKLEYGSLVSSNYIPKDPVKASTAQYTYEFIGWYLGDKLWDFENDVVTGETRLVSKFSETLRSYTVTIEGEGAKTYYYGDKIEKPADPVREDIVTSTERTRYEFLGWVKIGVTSKDWDFENDVVTGTMHLAQSWETITEPIENSGNDNTDSQPSTPNDSNGVEDSKGCAGIAGGMAGGVALLAAAFVALKKKEN